MMKPPKVQPPAPPPTINDARMRTDQADAGFRRSGRAATFVSSAMGRAEGGYGTKALTGQGG